MLEAKRKSEHCGDTTTVSNTILLRSPEQSKTCDILAVQNDALIYVVDCCDTERFTESSQELKEILQSYELRNTPVLILANKQDLPGSANSTEIFQAFDLQNILGERDCHVQETIASDGVGLLEGMRWVAKTTKDNRDQTEINHALFTCRT